MDTMDEHCVSAQIPGLEVDVSIEPDEAYIRLVWQEFFLARGRGLSLESHFPWLTKRIRQVNFVVAKRAGEVLGGLVILDKTSAMAQGAGRIGAIGLVVVRPDVRGHGYSRSLMRRGINAARQLGYDGLTLWTSKHAVYAPYGFELIDEAQLATVRNDLPAAPEGSIFSRITGLRASGSVREDCGIPPFALDTIRVEHMGCMLSLLNDGVRDILADAEGPTDKIADFLVSHMPRNWTLNTFKGDPVPNALESRGLHLHTQPVHLQMWLSLRPEVEAATLAAKGHFGVLDRI